MEKLLPIEELPHRLRKLREDRDLTQKQAAELCGYTQAQISTWEIGKNLPNLESLYVLAKNYGTTIADMLGEEAPICAPAKQPSPKEMAIFIIRAVGIDGFKLQRITEVLRDTRY